MTPTRLQSSARSWWLGALAGGSLVLAVVLVNVSPPAHSQAVTPQSGASFADVIETVSPAVVNIAVTKVMRATTYQVQPFEGQRGQRGQQAPEDLERFLERFFGGSMGASPFGAPFSGAPYPEPRAEGQGSGFIVDAEGHVVTNNHVIDGADEIVVTLQDGRKLDATLVGTDPRTDLAVLKVDGGNLPHVAFGDSSRARVGDWVVAIGNPFGLGGTATAGIISARGRDVRFGPEDNYLYDYLQIDAPINQGNSGGPVFNTAGAVIGVNTAIYSPNGGNVGIGFAIPAEQARKVVDELKTKGSVERGWLGVSIQNLDEPLAESLGLADTRGALVAEVVDGAPAHKAGIEAGDVIRRYDGRDVVSTRELVAAVADTDPESTVDVTVFRDGRNHELRVAIGSAQPQATAAAGREAPRGDGNAAAALGLTLRALTEQDRVERALPAGSGGVAIAAVDPASDAAAQEIRAGDVITHVNRRPVATVDAALAALATARAEGQSALLMLRRDGGQRFVALRFE